MNNAFTLIRLALASAVIFSHGYVLSGHPDDDPTRSLLPYPVSSLAVLLFFSLSGYLVVGGVRRKGVRVYAISRLLRLVPGLATMLVLTSAAGLAFSTMPVATYLADPSLHQYLWRNLIFLGRTYSISSVFTHNPLPTLVNGSLWTIPNEVRCYVGLAVIATAIRSRTALLAAFLTLLAVHLAIGDSPPVRRLIVSFAFGATLYLWRDHVPLSWAAAVAGLLLTFAFPAGSEFRATFLFLSATYLMLTIAMRSPEAVRRFSAALPDYSYGVYIYAFPVQQALVATHTSLLLTMPVTLALAAASWHLIEKPALRFKPDAPVDTDRAQATVQGSHH